MLLPQRRAAQPAPNRDRKGAGRDENFPLPSALSCVVFFITFSCYGQWVPGEAGVVDRAHNRLGGPTMPESERLNAHLRKSMKQPAYEMDQVRRAAVLSAIVETCRHRGWSLLAAHVRTTHVHAVIDAEAVPEQVMNSLKSYASRFLNQAGIDGADRRRWARHGSTRYLWTQDAITNAVLYVIEAQGGPMAVYEAPARLPAP